MAIQSKTLSSAEHDWYATRSGLPSNAPLNAHKEAYFILKGLIGETLATDVKSPSTAVNTDGGEGADTDPWTNPGNVTDSDDSYATAAVGAVQKSDFLDVSNFGLEVPETATITGVVVTVERKISASTSCRDNIVKLIVDGTVSGDNRALSTSWPTTETVQAYGSRGDNWGLSLTPAIVNATDFGVRIQIYTGASRTFSIDHVTITVYYTTSFNPAKPLTQMEREWLQSVGSSTSNNPFELWLNACQAQSVAVGKSIDECKFNFFTSVASGTNP